VAVSNKPMDLKVSRQGGAAVVHVRGAASMSEAERLRTTLEEVADQGLPVVVLELSKMEFICSMGLGAIISAHLRSRHHQGQIRLVNPTQSVRELLETTRLTKLFGIYESVQDALKS
jgi:anti-sigma B factor antagonist